MDARGEAQGPTDAELALLDALWTGVINAWDEDERHQKFLEHARLVGALPDAARRYGSLRDDPERGDLAKKRLGAIALLATNELYATRSSRPSKRVPGWLVAVAASVCVSLLGWAAWAFAMAGR